MSIKTDIAALRRRIKAIRLRLLGLRLVHGLGLLLPLGLALWAALHALAGYAQLPRTNLYATAGIAAGLGLIYLVLSLLAGLRTQSLAQRIDRESHNFDRSLSALSFARSERPTPLMELAVADAAQRAAGLRLNWPAEVRGRALAAKLGATLLCAGLLLASRAVQWNALVEPGDQALLPLPEQALSPDQQQGLLPEQVIPEEFMLPARGIIDNWRAELRRRQQQSPDKQHPAEEQQTPETHYGSAPGLVPGGAREATLRRPNAAVTGSDLSRLVDPTLDGDFAAAFAEMDRWVFSDEPLNSEDLREVSEMLDDSAESYRETGQSLISEVGQGKMQTGEGLELDGQVELEFAKKSAQQQSFAEFLEDYAGHLQRIADNAESVPLDENATGEMMMTSLPPPKDAELSMVPTDQPGQMQLAQSPLAQAQLPGSSEAGSGAGTPGGTMKPERVQGADGEVVDIESQVGEGRSPLQIIEDFSRAQREGLADQSFARLFDRYAADAQNELTVEALPVALKVYVRDYFMAIQPRPLPPR